MPQIERPTYRQPLRDLPLSLFIQPGASQPPSLIGKKRPYSPSSIVSPSKRRLLAVEGVLSPRSPFKKAVNDLKRALPMLGSPARNLLVEFQKPTPVPVDNSASGSSNAKGIRQPSFTLEGFHDGGGRKMKPVPKSLLAPEAEIGSANQPKPRVAAEPSKAEAELLAVLANAPKPTQVFLPGAGTARPMRNKEDDPEEVHYPGFDIYADEEGDGAEQEPAGRQDAPAVESMDAEDEDEEGSKENQAPYDPLRFATPTLSARSSMSSLGAPPRRRMTARSRLQAEVDGDAFSSDEEFL